MKNVLLLIVASATIGTAAGAQDVRSDAVACSDTVTAGLYRRCALWLEGSKVRRGVEGAVVARPSLFHPTRLQRLVAGDSAAHYAYLFERRTTQSRVLGLLGVTALAISVSKANCGGGYDGCAYDWGFNSAGFTMLVSGSALSAMSALFHVSASRAGMRAVWWNNERYTR